MLKYIICVATLIAAGPAFAAPAHDIASPDGHIVVHVAVDHAGAATYSVTCNGQTLLEPSPLGLDTTCGTWLTGLKLVGTTPAKLIDDPYRLLHGKRSACPNRANLSAIALTNDKDQSLRVVFRVSNDGVAFRYELWACDHAKTATVNREATGFNFPKTARAWLMPIDDDLSGWGRMNPCYERLYNVDIPVTQASPSSDGWAFPALFHANGVWALVSESNVDGGYCASRLTTATDEGLLTIKFPDPRGNNGKTPAEPHVKLPFKSPWRVIVLGDSLKPIIESTLVQDVAEPSKLAKTDFVKPGKAAWGWLREQNKAMTVERQTDFIDMAAKLGLEYCLIDAEWDARIGYEKMAKLVKHAANENVGIWLWYNSNGDFNDASQTPKDKMDTHAARAKEFKRLRDMGVSGVKVDFFGGDKQATMQLYADILKDAANAGILVNFHGATIPRGWDRTWPNLMTMEGVRGEENLAWDPKNADREAEHCCILPFTRNAVGPMDFTPNCLGHHYDPKHLRDRYASLAFELALTVVYESGVQHLGITPEDAAHIPDFVTKYFHELPRTWDDTKFVDGLPGKYVVIARRSGDKWFIAGINGQTTPQEITSKLDFLKKTQSGKLIVDTADKKNLEQRDAEVGGDKPLKLTIPPHGGFVFDCEN